MLLLTGVALAIAAVPAAAQATLTCHSDGTETEKMREVRMALPAGTRRVTATVSQPESGGTDMMGIVLANAGAEPDHYAGLLTDLNRPRPMVNGEYSGAPMHWRGFSLVLMDRVKGTAEPQSPPVWVIAANRFTIDLSLETPGSLKTRLGWTLDGQVRDVEHNVTLVRNDFSQLILACYFGDVTLSDIRFQ